MVDKVIDLEDPQLIALDEEPDCGELDCSTCGEYGDEDYSVEDDEYLESDEDDELFVDDDVYETDKSIIFIQNSTVNLTV